MLIDSATETQLGETTGFLHDAFVYNDDEEFVRHTAPFLRDGVTAGEVVLAALPEPRIALLREVLGSAADQVAFLDITSAGRNPARIIPLWRNVLDQNPHRGVRGIGEPAYRGRSEAGFEEAKLHEALLNVAFEHTGPFRLRCPYDAAVVSATLDPTENHPFVHDSNGSSRGAGPRTEVASMIFRTPLPAVPEDAERMEFGLAELTEVRHWVNARARERGLSADRIDDLALALHEVCTNSIRFGGGRGELSLWIADDSLICEVADQGSIDDLLVGRVLPPVEGLGGRGVWLANQLCDLVQLRSGAGFTQVRLHTHLG
ncbi:MAG TPA: sensor histidine kinase [Kribbella sp.]|uniref:sensor histidine kinase n=1 Tax=Kribbella sp. TaxID=1871183 RepID=UPI002D78BE3D|nr:sensor histidine kinase [Kribbella sp.]HET6296355.1 sensor histidine kinase [Kribbella sp.]